MTLQGELSEMEANIEKETPKSEVSVRDTDDLDRAVERIYEQYGTDLSEFFRDAYREAKKCQSQKNHAED